MRYILVVFIAYCFGLGRVAAQEPTAYIVQLRNATTLEGYTLTPLSKQWRIYQVEIATDAPELTLSHLRRLPQVIAAQYDHGSIRVNQASRVIGDRDTTTNLRYKVGKNLQYDKRDVFDVRRPEDAHLPRPNVSSTFIFAKGDRFFLYPNNYNHFNNYYTNTFQHGGISLEEIIVPIIKLRSRKQ